MLLPADSYKLAWATGETTIEARFVARTLKGFAAAFALAQMRPFAKRVIHAAGPMCAGLKSAFSFRRHGARLPVSRAKETAT
jgi:CelD/BcsL family acetyltransferase involved in cellulose biosynthesis